MPQQTISLSPVDAVRVTLVMDNTFDVLMAGNEVVRRFPLRLDFFEHETPLAEHGFSALIEVERDGRTGVVLFDTGVSRTGILRNLDVLGINARDIQAIVLSHGHADHAMGLPGLIDRLGSRNVPLILHPDAYLERRVILPTGEELQRLPPPRKSDLEREHIALIEEAGPSMLVDDMLLVSGEVARTTRFETGFPIHQARRQGVWEPDPLIMDDQCAIANVRDKGLVIVTGCGHSGIINVIRNAQLLTGVPAIYAVVGGFHLSGAMFESRIPPTIAALQAIGPRFVMPGHCTGWIATHQIARTMPDAFVANSVGTTLSL